MPENEFEKQVQQKMDGLKVKPSEQVWQHVAGAIVKRKTDRRIFAIVMLCLLIAAGGIFLLNITSRQYKNNSLIIADNTDLKNSKETSSFNNDPSKQIVDRQKKSVAKNVDSVSSLSTTSKDGQVLKIQNEKNEFLQAHKSAKIISAKSFKTVAENSIPDKEETLNHSKKGFYKTSRKISASIKNALPADSVNEEIVAGEVPATIIIEKIFPLNDMKIVGPFLNPYNKIGVEINANNLLAIQAKNYSVEILPIKKVNPLQQKYQWKIGINFSVGASSTQNGYLGIVSSGNGNASVAYTSAGQVPGCTNCANNGVSYRPSAIKPSVGLVLGIFVQKNISPKIAFSIGLNYKMYNSVMMIGSKVDSAIIANNNSSYLSQSDFFYRTGSSTRYKNHFHFLEIPLALNIKLGKQNKHPLYLNTGISIAQLIATNALQFDTASTKYYSNNSLFNKTQIGISAGLLFSLSGSAKNPFLVGPDIHFSINRMAATGLYQSSNYSYFGIQVKKIFGKK